MKQFMLDIEKKFYKELKAVDMVTKKVVQYYTHMYYLTYELNTNILFSYLF